MVPKRPEKSFHFPDDPPMHFRATLSGFPSCLPRFYRWPRSTSDQPQNAPRIRSLALQHFRRRSSFFSFPLLKERPKSIALLSESPAFRVWLPSSRRCFLTTSTLEASFSPQRSWASPFRAFLPLGDPKPVSQPRFVPALCYKTR